MPVYKMEVLAARLAPLSSKNRRQEEGGTGRWLGMYQDRQYQGRIMFKVQPWGDNSLQALLFGIDTGIYYLYLAQRPHHWPK